MAFALICRVCLLEKPSDAMKLRLGKRVDICKLCDAARARHYNATHKAERQAYNQAYRRRAHALASERARLKRRHESEEYRATQRVRHRKARQVEAVKNYNREYQRRYQRERQQEVRAHSAVRYALKTGRLEKPFACVKCGEDRFKLHGHHRDYTKPLDVQWLCPRCHKIAHKQEEKVA